MEMTAGAVEIEVTLLAEQLRHSTGTSQQSFKCRTVVHGMTQQGYKLPEGVSDSKMQAYREQLMDAFAEGLTGRVMRSCWSATFVGILNDLSSICRMPARDAVEMFLGKLTFCMLRLDSVRSDAHAMTTREQFVQGCVSYFKQSSPFLKSVYDLADSHGLLTVERVHALRDAALNNYAEGGFSHDAGLPHATEFMAIVNEALMRVRIPKDESPKDPAGTPRHRRAQL